MVFRISELQQSHASEIARLKHAHSSEIASIQQTLQEEKTKRDTAERSLEAQRDVAIPMEDVQPFATLGSGDPVPKTLGKTITCTIIY